MKKKTGRPLRRLWSVLIALVLGLGGAVVAVQPAQASAPILLTGSSWFGGNGVNVCSNASGGGSDPYCGSELHVGGVSGAWWQCVELAQRFYQAKGWHGGIFGGVNYAYQIYDNASSLGMSRQANGSITSIVPGDMIIHGSNDPFSWAGHVAIVDSISGSTINVVEQNGPSANGRATYTWSGGSLSRGSSAIVGVVHDPANNSSNTTADTDGDGVLDSSDWCPLVSGLAINNGCPRRNSQNLTTDFNEDGRTDTAAFFNYGSGHLALFTWNGRTDGNFDSPVKKWQELSGWGAERLTPIGTGDFDGDTHQDVASFFNYGSGALGLFVWYGNGDGSFAAASRIWFAASGWDGARITPAGTTDLNEDGATDIAAFFNYGGGNTALFTWDGQADRTLDPPVNRWQATSGWDATRLTAGVAGDFNGDGNQDLTAFFDYGGSSTGAIVWSGNGNGSFAAPDQAWFVSSGWESARIIPAGTADLNEDGRSDVAAYFNYGNGHTALFTWNGRTDGNFDSPVKKWQELSGWDASRITPIGNGDFNGDGNQDITAFFDYGGSSTGAFIWSGPGNGSITSTVQAWFVSSGWESARIIP